MVPVLHRLKSPNRHVACESVHRTVLASADPRTAGTTAATTRAIRRLGPWATARMAASSRRSTSTRPVPRIVARRSPRGFDWTDSRNTVTGVDAREASADDADATADVQQCRQVVAGGSFTGDTCARAGGLDQDIYADQAP